MAVDNDFDRVGTRGRDEVVEAGVGHAWTKVLDEVTEVIGEPGIWSKDEGWSGLEEAFQDVMILALVLWRILCSSGRRLWYALIKSSVCTFSDGSHVLSLCGYPFHLMRYCTWRRRPNMR